MNIPLIRQDWANHGVYCAAWFNLVFAILVVPAYMYAALEGVLTALEVAFAAVVVVSLLKEWMDKRANLRARLEGRPLPHGVEAADVIAGMVGGILSAFPVGLVLVLLFMTQNT